MDSNEAQFEEIISYYQSLQQPLDQDTVVELLREVQEIYGAVPKRAQERIAAALELKPALLSVLVKRFPSLKEQAYEHRVTVCTGPRCMRRGAGKVLDAAEQALGIRCGACTKDGRFFLTTQNCMKKCGHGPNVRIDDTLYAGVEPETVVEIIKKYQ